MKTLTFEDRDSWLAARRGKITGSRLGDLIVKRGDGKKIGFYELIAERLGIPADDENAMDRGTRLEPEALEMYTKETGRVIDTSRVIWMRDDNEDIAISPDGFEGTKLAVEAKCLASSRHIEALLTGRIPKDYQYQRLQYFAVNDDLDQLDFAFYDPRLIAKPFFIISTYRHELNDDVLKVLAEERDIMTEVNQIVLKLSNF